MAKDGHAGCSDQPEECVDWRGVEEERHPDDEEDAVELRGGDAVAAELEIAPVELADRPHAADDEEDEEEEGEVGEQGVDAQHHEDGGVVAGEMAQVPVYPGLCLTKVLGLGHALEVEEFRDGLEVGEAGCDGLGADAGEAVGEVEAGGEDVQRDLKTRHGGCCVVFDGQKACSRCVR